MQQAEKLKLETVVGLRIYCVGMRLRNRYPMAPKQELPYLPVFYVANSMDQVNERIFKTYGPCDMDIRHYADAPLKDLVDQIDLGPQKLGREIVLEQFVNGLKLAADRYASPEDRQSLHQIINRIDFNK